MVHHVLVNEDDIVLAIYGEALEKMADDRKKELETEFSRPLRKLTIIGRMKPYIGQKL